MNGEGSLQPNSGREQFYHDRTLGVGDHKEILRCVLSEDPCSMDCLEAQLGTIVTLGTQLWGAMGTFGGLLRQIGILLYAPCFAKKNVPEVLYEGTEVLVHVYIHCESMLFKMTEHSKRHTNSE